MAEYIRKFQDGGAAAVDNQAPPTTEKRTFKVGNQTVDLQAYEDQLNNDFQNFYNAYSGNWSNKRRQEVIEQHRTFMRNLDNGNITGLNIDGTFNVVNPENSGLNFETGKAGEIHAWYAAQEANFLSQRMKQAEATRPKKRFTNTTLAEDFTNRFYGGSPNIDEQTWFDLDELTTDESGNSSRGTDKRVEYLKDWLNNFDLTKYEVADDSLGGLEGVKQRMARLRNALSDGTLNNEDYAAAQALGLNLRNMMDSYLPQKEETEEPQQNRWQQMLNYGNADDLYNKVNAWNDFPEFSSHIGKAERGATDYLKNRLSIDHTLNSSTVGAYYRNDFFPKFFSYLNDEKFSPEYVSQHKDERVQTWEKGGTPLYKYLNQNLTLAIRNKERGGSSLLNNEISDQLNPIGDGYWTVPGSFNEEKGTMYLFNPDSGDYKKVSLKNPKYKNLLLSYWANRGLNPQNEPQSVIDWDAPYYYGGTATQQESDARKDEILKQLIGDVQPTATKITDDGGISPETEEQGGSRIWNNFTAGLETAWQGAKQFFNNTDDGGFGYDLSNRLGGLGKVVTGVIGATIGNAFDSFVGGLLGQDELVEGIGSLFDSAKYEVAANKLKMPWNVSEEEINEFVKNKVIQELEDKGYLKNLSEQEKQALINKNIKAEGDKRDFINGIIALLPVGKGAKTLKKGIRRHPVKAAKAVKEGVKEGYKKAGEAKEAGAGKWERFNEARAKEKKKMHEEYHKKPTPEETTGKTSIVDSAKEKVSIAKRAKELKAEGKSWKEALKQAREEAAAKKEPAKTSEGVSESAESKTPESKAPEAKTPKTDTPVESKDAASSEVADKTPAKETPAKETSEAETPSNAETPETNKTSEKNSEKNSEKSGEKEDKPKDNPDEKKTDESKDSKTGESKEGKATEKSKESRAEEVIDEIAKEKDRKARENTAKKKAFRDLLKATRNAGLAVGNAQQSVSSRKRQLVKQHKSGGIIKALGGTKFWYDGIQDYDKTKYISDYDTSKLVNADDFSDAWVSNVKGYDQYRYGPTQHGNYGENNDHWNYTSGIEGKDYYKQFGKDLFDENGNPTPMGIAWMQATDKLLPENSRARFYDSNDELIKLHNPTSLDVHGRGASVLDSLAKYTDAVRNDHILGARHNVFLKRGKRYFYTDENGVQHWVDPDIVSKYKVSENPVTSGWNEDKTTFWDDYEITGLLDNPQNNPQQNDNVLGTLLNQSDPSKGNRIDLSNLYKFAPAMLGALRAGMNVGFNNRNTRRYLADRQVPLVSPYQTYRQTYGDYIALRGAEDAAARIQNLASRPRTSDSQHNALVMLEGIDKANQYRLKGEQQNAETVRKTGELAAQHQDKNTERAWQAAVKNNLSLAEEANYRASVNATNRKQNHDIWWNKWYPAYVEHPLVQAVQERKAKQKYLDFLGQKNYLDSLKPDLSWYEQAQLDKYNKATTEEEKQAIMNETLNTKKAVANAYQRNYINALARLNGLRNRYTSWTPSIATPGYFKNGGDITTTMVKERNKDNERLWKQIEHIAERFWRQYGKMKQPDFVRIIK